MGKRKGTGFENEVAKLLSRATGEDFDRSSGSGGARLAGDIVVPSWFPFLPLECKHVSVDLVNLWTLLDVDVRRMKDCFVLQTMRRAMEECSNGHYPALVVRPNRRADILVITDWSDRPLEWYDPKLWGSRTIIEVPERSPARLGLFRFDMLLRILAEPDLRGLVSI